MSGALADNVKLNKRYNPVMIMLACVVFLRHSSSKPLMLTHVGHPYIIIVDAQMMGLWLGNLPMYLNTSQQPSYFVAERMFLAWVWNFRHAGYLIHSSKYSKAFDIDKVMVVNGFLNKPYYRCDIDVYSCMIFLE